MRGITEVQTIDLTDERGNESGTDQEREGIAAEIERTELTENEKIATEEKTGIPLKGRGIETERETAIETEIESADEIAIEILNVSGGPRERNAVETGMTIRVMRVEIMTTTIPEATVQQWKEFITKARHPIIQS